MSLEAYLGTWTCLPDKMDKMMKGYRKKIEVADEAASQDETKRLRAQVTSAHSCWGIPVAEKRTLLISALSAGGTDNGPRLIARDKATGEVFGSVDLPSGAIGYTAPQWQAALLRLLGTPPLAVPISALELIALSPEGGASGGGGAAGGAGDLTLAHTPDAPLSAIEDSSTTLSGDLPFSAYAFTSPPAQASTASRNVAAVDIHAHPTAPPINDTASILRAPYLSPNGPTLNCPAA